MNALEQLICPTNELRAQFEQDCAECFASIAGSRVLAALVAAAHPLQHTPGMSEHEHGRREVVATLWRFGSSKPTLPEPKKPEPPPTKP